MANKDDLGRRGEALAADYLIRGGYRVVDRNWRCPGGEIDIVARDGADLVIVEVKSRASMAFGDPLAAVTQTKLTRLWRLASAWRQAHPDHGGARTRFDVIGVLAPYSENPSIEHLRAIS